MGFGVPRLPRRIAWRLVLSAVALLGVALPGRPAGAPISSHLSAWKVEQKGGQEALVAAGKVAPGDVIEYRVEYRNAGSKDVRDMVATLPIPAAMSYVERSTK